MIERDAVQGPRTLADPLTGQAVDPERPHFRCAACFARYRPESGQRLHSAHRGQCIVCGAGPVVLVQSAEAFSTWDWVKAAAQNPRWRWAIPAMLIAAAAPHVWPVLGTRPEVPLAAPPPMRVQSPVATADTVLQSTEERLAALRRNAASVPATPSAANRPPVAPAQRAEPAAPTPLRNDAVTSVVPRGEAGATVRRVAAEPLASQRPEPIGVQRSDQAAAKGSEPVIAKPSEPVAAKPSEPVAAKPSEPVAAKPSEPVAAKPSEPVAAKPAVAKSPEPVVAQSSAPPAGRSPEPAASAQQPAADAQPSDAPAVAIAAVRPGVTASAAAERQRESVAVAATAASAAASPQPRQESALGLSQREQQAVQAACASLQRSEDSRAYIRCVATHLAAMRSGAATDRVAGTAGGSARPETASDPVAAVRSGRDASGAPSLAAPSGTARRGIPPNAVPYLDAEGWTCIPGYRRVGDWCEPQSPARSAPVASAQPRAPDCPQGSRLDGDRCVPATIPRNAQLTASGGWECLPGHVLYDSRYCIPLMRRGTR